MTREDTLVELVDADGAAVGKATVATKQSKNKIATSRLMPAESVS